MKRFLTYALPVILFVSVITACEKEYDSIETTDSRNVAAYIQANKLNVTQYQETGIYYEVINRGTGKDLEYSDQVPMIFTIKSIDGKYVAIDTLSSNNRYFNFLGYFSPEGVRVGVKEVLKKTGTMRMIIPSRLAFGRNGVGDIPGNASLDLTVRVLDKSKMPEYEDASIVKYLAANNMTGFTRTSSGLYYKISDAGTGSPITLDSTVVAEYTGKFLNGKVFDKTSIGNGATFDLNGDTNPNSQPIQGWQEAIPLIKQGGSIRMVLPSALAYGLSGTSSGIPPFSSLDFEVKITDVKKE